MRQQGLRQMRRRDEFGARRVILKLRFAAVALIVRHDVGINRMMPVQLVPVNQRAVAIRMYVFAGE